MNVLLKYLKVYSKKLIAIISKSGVKYSNSEDFAHNTWQYSRPLYNMSFNDMIYTKLLNAYRINSIHSEKLLAIWIHIQKLQLFDKTFMAFFILYKFHGILIEMNLNTHIFSQKIKLIVSSLYRNLPINPGTFFHLPNDF